MGKCTFPCSVAHGKAQKRSKMLFEGTARGRESANRWGNALSHAAWRMAKRKNGPKCSSRARHGDVKAQIDGEMHFPMQRGAWQSAKTPSNALRGHGAGPQKHKKIGKCTSARSAERGKAQKRHQMLFEGARVAFTLGMTVPHNLLAVNRIIKYG